MKIGIIVRLLHPAGAQKTSIIEAQYLAKLGHDVTVFFIRKPKNFSYYYEDLLKGINYRILYSENPSRKRYLYDFVTGLYMPDRKGELRVDLNLLKKFYEQIKGEKFEYLICHDQYAGISGYYSHKRLGIPYSIMMHERIPDLSKVLIGPLVTRGLDHVMMNSKYLFSISEKITQTIISFDERLSKKIVYNIHGMNYPAKSYSYKDKRDEIISVSLWDSGRKPFIYADLAKQLPDRKFVLIGSWREKHLKEKFLEKVGNEKIENIFLKEGVPERELSENIARAKFLLRFGFGEYGVAGAILESVQSLTPVILNSGLGTAQMISEMGGGFVIDDIRNVPKLIMKSENETSYSNLQESLKKIKEKYTWELHAKKLLNGNSPVADP